jgi:hypothetical protein
MARMTLPNQHWLRSMLNRRLFFLSFVLVGCSHQQELVFVDLSSISLSEAKPTSVTNVASSGLATAQGTKTIPGEPEVVIENLKADEKAAIRLEVEKETNDAVETISRHLHDYYSREIDDFYKAQFAKLQPFKQSLTEKYLTDIRAIFEKSATKRGPLLTRLTLLTEFPPSEKLIPIDEKESPSPGEKRRKEIRELQKSLIEIDFDYETAIASLVAKNSATVDQETERIFAVIAAKQSEIDQRALAEATKLVRRFSNVLSQRIFSRYTFLLKEIPTKTINFPKMPVQSGVPRVTFDRNQLSRNERVELSKELEAFLSLNHYQRAAASDGAKDVTKEFIEWRTNLKSGHWESWQKSSAPK